MRVLVTGRAIPTQPDRCTGQQLALGFQEAGHEAVFYGNFYGQPYRFLGAKEAMSEKFDLVVITEMNDGMPGYQSLFSHHNLKDVPRLYWDFDVSYHPERSCALAASYNPHAYLVGNKQWVDNPQLIGSLPSLFLPYACSPSIHRRLSNVERENLVGFVGSITAEREKLLEKVHVVTGAFGEDLIMETNKLGAMIHVNQDACAGLVPGRPFETTGCGTPLICFDQQSYDDFTDLLPDFLREHVFCLEGDVQKIDDWIDTWKDEDLMLEKVGLELMEYMHKEHSYRKRAESIIEFAEMQGLLDEN